MSGYTNFPNNFQDCIKAYLGHFFPIKGTIADSKENMTLQLPPSGFISEKKAATFLKTRLSLKEKVDGLLMRRKSENTGGGLGGRGGEGRLFPFDFILFLQD